MSNHITLTGNMAGPVELRFTPSGKAVASLRLADTPRRFNKDTQAWEDAGDTLWVDVSIWEAEAEALAERAGNYKGKATVTGTLGVRSWEKDGEKRQQVTIRAESVALHAERKRGDVPGFNTDSTRRAGNGYAAPRGGAQDDPWATKGQTVTRGNEWTAGHGINPGEPLPGSEREIEAKITKELNEH